MRRTDSADDRQRALRPCMPDKGHRITLHQVKTEFDDISTLFLRPGSVAFSDP